MTTCILHLFVFISRRKRQKGAAKLGSSPEGEAKNLLLNIQQLHESRVQLGFFINEFSRECLAIRISRKLKATDVIDALSDLFILRGIPTHIRSDNGPEFIAQNLRDWLAAVGAKTAYIMPGSPWENGYCESYNSNLRDELLNGEIFYTLKEAKIVIEGWRRHYKTIRPHSSLRYQPPSPEVLQ